MTNSPPPMEKKPRPGSVTFAVSLQLLLAAFLVVSAITSLLYGAEAQEAFEAELERQGVELEDIGTTTGGFEGGGASLVLPIIVIAILVTLALLNGAGNRVGRILTWIFQPLVLICGGFLFAGSIFAGQLMQWGFDNSGDETLENLDAQAMIDAAYGAYPSWTIIVDIAVLVLATLGSLLVIILLAVPSSNAFFRKEPPPTYIPGAPTQ